MHTSRQKADFVGLALLTLRRCRAMSARTIYYILDFHVEGAMLYFKARKR